MTFPRLVFAAILAVLPVPTAADVFRSGQSWGAIAYAPQQGEWGWARNYATRLGAEQAALAQCRGAALQGCTLVAVTQAACAALAVGPRGWGAGIGPNPREARSRALTSCQSDSRGCAEQLAFCASPPGAPIAVFR